MLTRDHWPSHCVRGREVARALYTMCSWLYMYTAVSTRCTMHFAVWYCGTPICNIEQFFSIVIIGKILWENIFDKLPRYLDIDKRLHQYFLRRATTYGNIFLSLSLSFCTLVGLFNELNLTKHVSKFTFFRFGSSFSSNCVIQSGLFL